MPLLLALLLGGGALAAVLATRDHPSATTAAVQKPRTVVTTVTQKGTTRLQTVTATAPPPPTVPSTSTTATTAATTATTAAPTGGSPTALVDRSTALIRAGDYANALPLAESALAQLQNTGQTYEAYASYNTAYARFALGRCDGVLALLDRSEQVQGGRSEIDSLRKQARKTCGKN